MLFDFAYTSFYTAMLQQKEEEKHISECVLVLSKFDTLIILTSVRFVRTLCGIENQNGLIVVRLRSQIDWLYLLGRRINLQGREGKWAFCSGTEENMDCLLRDTKD